MGISPLRTRDSKIVTSKLPTLIQARSLIWGLCSFKDSQNVGRRLEGANEQFEIFLTLTPLFLLVVTFLLDSGLTIASASTKNDLFILSGSNPINYARTKLSKSTSLESEEVDMPDGAQN